MPSVPDVRAIFPLRVTSGEATALGLRSGIIHGFLSKNIDFDFNWNFVGVDVSFVAINFDIAVRWHAWKIFASSLPVNPLPPQKLVVVLLIQVKNTVHTCHRICHECYYRCLAAIISASSLGRFC